MPRTFCRVARSAADEEAHNHTTTLTPLHQSHKHAQHHCSLHAHSSLHPHSSSSTALLSPLLFSSSHASSRSPPRSVRRPVCRQCRHCSRLRSHAHSKLRARGHRRHDDRRWRRFQSQGCGLLAGADWGERQLCTAWRSHKQQQQHAEQRETMHRIAGRIAHLSSLCSPALPSQTTSLLPTSTSGLAIFPCCAQWV